MSARNVLSTAEQIARLEKANTAAKQQSAARNKKLLELRNQQALETATLWLAIDRMESDRPGIHRVTIHGVSSFVSSRQGAFHITHFGAEYCEIRIGHMETQEQAYLYLACGQETKLTFVSGRGKNAYVSSNIFHVFDSLAAAENWKRRQTLVQDLGPLAMI